jgi:hypothetical protein
MSTGIRATANRAINKYNRKGGPLSARVACHNPNTPMMVRKSAAKLCTYIPDRRGGRKENTSLTRGIIVEFGIRKLEARRGRMCSIYLILYTTLTDADKVNCPGEMGTLCPPPPTPAAILLS